MENKLRVLFVNKDGAGVNYWRTIAPATELERNHSDIFVEINPDINFEKEETMDYLKSFDIIHYHTTLVDKINLMRNIASELKRHGVTLVLDIDDYWKLPKKHPQYQYSVDAKLEYIIIENIKIADYITTTTDLFAVEIKKITGKNNVIVLPNSVNPEWMKQFQDNKKPSYDGKVRIVYMGGSSHLPDLEQIKGVVNMLNGDPDTKDKFKIILAGWDSRGGTVDVKINEEFIAELKRLGLLTKNNIQLLNRSNGNVDVIPKLPKSIADKYRGNVIIVNQRAINSNESVYLKYEDILTDNHRIITDENYKQWLMSFHQNGVYPYEGNFGRRWTQKANAYASVLDEADIVIAPLDDNQFNRCKSNLKQVECWSRKLPIVCSGIPPYTVDGKHMENCVLIPFAKNSFKDWKKYLKKLILDKELRTNIGERLYEDFKDKYNLKTVTEKRADFYRQIINNKT